MECCNLFYAVIPDATAVKHCGRRFISRNSLKYYNAFRAHEYIIERNVGIDFNKEDRMDIRAFPMSICKSSHIHIYYVFILQSICLLCVFMKRGIHVMNLTS